jgi:hypothetical protein
VPRVGRRLLQRLDNHPLHVVVADRAGSTRAGLVMQTIEPMHDKPGAPLAYRHPAHTETLGDFDVRATLGAGQHNPAPQRQRLRARMAPSPTLERVALAVAEHQLGHPCAPLSHRCLPSSSMTTTGTRPLTPKFLTAHETPTQVTRTRLSPGLPRGLALAGRRSPEPASYFDLKK